MPGVAILLYINPYDKVTLFAMLRYVLLCGTSTGAGVPEIEHTIKAKVEHLYKGLLGVEEKLLARFLLTAPTDGILTGGQGAITRLVGPALARCSKCFRLAAASSFSAAVIAPFTCQCM